MEIERLIKTFDLSIQNFYSGSLKEHQSSDWLRYKKRVFTKETLIDFRANGLSDNLDSASYFNYQYFFNICERVGFEFVLKNSLTLNIGNSPY